MICDGAGSVVVGHVMSCVEQTGGAVAQADLCDL
jgi:hypothetical protein